MYIIFFLDFFFAFSVTWLFYILAVCFDCCFGPAVLFEACWTKVEFVQLAHCLPVSKQIPIIHSVASIAEFSQCLLPVFPLVPHSINAYIERGWEFSALGYENQMELSTNVSTICTLIILLDSVFFYIFLVFCFFFVELYIVYFFRICYCMWFRSFGISGRHVNIFRWQHAQENCLLHSAGYFRLGRYHTP